MQLPSLFHNPLLLHGMRASHMENLHSSKLCSLTSSFYCINSQLVDVFSCMSMLSHFVSGFLPFTLF